VIGFFSAVYFVKIKFCFRLLLWYGLLLLNTVCCLKIKCNSCLSSHDFWRDISGNARLSMKCISITSSRHDRGQLGRDAGSWSPLDHHSSFRWPIWQMKYADIFTTAQISHLGRDSSDPKMSNSLVYNTIKNLNNSSVAGQKIILIASISTLLRSLTNILMNNCGFPKIKILSIHEIVVEFMVM
jgi:hypothetical protein